MIPFISSTSEAHPMRNWVCFIFYVCLKILTS
nr:MAG TPA: hypothetical protein [Caudoviricetes sp.]